MILTAKKKISLEENGKQIIEKATAAGIGGASLGLLAGAALDANLLRMGSLS
jgi:hypothetical protein